jgi:integrase
MDSYSPQYLKNSPHYVVNNFPVSISNSKTYLEPEDITAIEKVAYYLRDRRLIRLLSHLGCRVTESINITVDDIDFTSSTIKILHLKTLNRLTILNLKPKRGGFRRAFGCGWFVREFLSGHAPYGAPNINPEIGAPQSDIFREYEEALLRILALDKATDVETRIAKRLGCYIDPENINRLYGWYFPRIPHKRFGFRYHSCIIYFRNIIRLGRVEPSGLKEPYAFQSNYPSRPSRKYYGLTAIGRTASDISW